MTLDITDRKEVDRLKDEFVSVVSHELRTPLTSIRGSLGLLASGRLGTLQEKGQRMLDIAVANTDRLVRLINDILDIERMQSGKIAMQKQECNAADLMTQAAEVMRAMAEKAGVTLFVVPHSTPLWADPDRILQTLTNLISVTPLSSRPVVARCGLPLSTRMSTYGLPSRITDGEFQPISLTAFSSDFSRSMPRTRGTRGAPVSV